MLRHWEGNKSFSLTPVSYLLMFSLLAVDRSYCFATFNISEASVLEGIPGILFNLFRLIALVMLQNATKVV